MILFYIKAALAFYVLYYFGDTAAVIPQGLAGKGFADTLKKMPVPFAFKTLIPLAFAITNSISDTYLQQLYSVKTGFGMIILFAVCYLIADKLDEYQPQSRAYKIKKD